MAISFSPLLKVGYISFEAVTPLKEVKLMKKTIMLKAVINTRKARMDNKAFIDWFISLIQLRTSFYLS